MDQTLLAYAERQTPRYTSYPTAPHFHAGVTGETYRRWLGDLTETTTLSLYLHIPFCREICFYCGCHTFATRQDGPIANYAGTLAREIDRTADATPARRVLSIAWGGGTPNILKPEAFRGLADRLRERFDLGALEEHAVEIDPRLLSPAQAEAFASAGVTRASLGVQDLNAHVQEAIGRIQPRAQVAAAVDQLRAAGVRGVNIDLIYGLPLQSKGDVRRSARMAAEMRPDRLAAFGYAHVPWFKTRQRMIREEDLPGTAERFAHSAAIREELESLGYVAIGFDHYALPGDDLARAAADGTLKRSFQGFTGDRADALIGMGASAISSLPQGYAQNAPDPASWARALEAGSGFATARGVALTPEDRVRRAIIDRLLADGAADLSAHGGLAAFADAQAPLAQLEADGLLAIRADRIEMTPRGAPFGRLAAEAFDAYRPAAPARHSRTV